MINIWYISHGYVTHALEIVPYFDGSNKVPLTIFIEVCKEAKEMVPNAEGNLV